MYILPVSYNWSSPKHTHPHLDITLILERMVTKIKLATITVQKLDHARIIYIFIWVIVCVRCFFSRAKTHSNKNFQKFKRYQNQLIISNKIVFSEFKNNFFKFCRCGKIIPVFFSISKCMRASHMILFLLQMQLIKIILDSIQ